MKTKVFFLIMLLAGVACAQTPYYQGTYPSDDSNSGASAPSDNSAPPPANPPPPPVVYQRVPVYRQPVYYRAPAWASPNAAALAPWPGSFEFGGGPTTITGSNNQLTSGSNFMVGGGYNFSPRAGLMLEFSNAWLGLSDNALQQAGAVNGDAQVWSVTLDPIWRFRIAGPIGGYIIGGGGYYQRTEDLIVPFQGFIPPFGFVTGSEKISNTDDAGGVNIGAGLTWNMGWGTKFFVEARYNRLFLPGNETQFIPIVFGLRW